MATQRITVATANFVRTSRSADEPLERLGAATGAVAFGLAIGAIVVSASTGTNAANPGAGANEIARAYATTPSPLVWVGALLQLLAYLFLFGFVSYVGTAVREATSKRSDWLGAAATGAAQAFVAITVAGFAIGGVARFRAGPALDLPLVLALFDIHVALYIASWALGAAFLGATAAVALRTGVLPRWLSVATALIVVISLAAVALPTTPLSAMPNLWMWLWTLAASLVLLRRGPSNQL
jgi:hypothetical protein